MQRVQGSSAQNHMGKKKSLSVTAVRGLLTTLKAPCGTRSASHTLVALVWQLLLRQAFDEGHHRARVRSGCEGAALVHGRHHMVYLFTVSSYLPYLSIYLSTLSTCMYVDSIFVGRGRRRYPSPMFTWCQPEVFRYCSEHRGSERIPGFHTPPSGYIWYVLPVA